MNECTCSGPFLGEWEHATSCPASLYQAGIQRGQAEAAEQIAAWLAAKLRVSSAHLDQSTDDYNRTVHAAQMNARHDDVTEIRAGAWRKQGG